MVNYHETSSLSELANSATANSATANSATADFTLTDGGTLMSDHLVGDVWENGEGNTGQGRSPALVLRRPWLLPTLQDFELAMEVTAYAGRV